MRWANGWVANTGTAPAQTANHTALHNIYLFRHLYRRTGAFVVLLNDDSCELLWLPPFVCLCRRKSQERKRAKLKRSNCTVTSLLLRRWILLSPHSPTASKTCRRAAYLIKLKIFSFVFTISIVGLFGCFWSQAHILFKDACLHVFPGKIDFPWH